MSRVIRCASASAAILIFTIAPPAKAEAASPERILQEMEQTYAALRSYSDTSTAEFRNPDGSEGAQVEFKIWFARPKLFRIDGTTRSAPDAAPVREAIWFDGEIARMWSSTSPVVTRGKIQLAGSKMFGTYAYHVPTLLEASYGGPKRLHQLDSPSAAGDETIDGADCHHIRGTWQADPYDVWIGKADHLVRKIVAEYSGYRMEEMHREIKANQTIDASVFHFAPEEEVGGPLKKATPPPPLPGEHRRP